MNVGGGECLVGNVAFYEGGGDCGGWLTLHFIRGVVNVSDGERHILQGGW